jgi:hypothetical protein
MSGINKVIGIDKTVIVTPTITTSAYTAGDQVGGIQTLSNVFPDLQRGVNYVNVAGWSKYPGHVILQSLTVTDVSEQAPNFDLFFFNELPTVASSDNAALDIADSEIAKCIGHYAFAPTYGDAGGFDVGSVANINLMLPQQPDFANANLYVVVSTSSTPTFTTTSALTFKYSFFVD